MLPRPTRLGSTQNSFVQVRPSQSMVGNTPSNRERQIKESRNADLYSDWSLAFYVRIRRT